MASLGSLKICALAHAHQTRLWFITATNACATLQLDTLDLSRRCRDRQLWL
jgi:hypothetical protein